MNRTRVRYLAEREVFELTTGPGHAVELSREQLLGLQAEARRALKAHAEDVIRQSRPYGPHLALENER
jgi:hypothetical protein